jgi:hypothetical protein
MLHLCISLQCGHDGSAECVGPTQYRARRERRTSDERMNGSPLPRIDNLVWLVVTADIFVAPVID